MNSGVGIRSEEHTSELQSLRHLVCRLLLEKKKNYDYPGGFGESDVHSHMLGIGQRRGRKWYFFFKDAAPTEIYPLSLHDALPICSASLVWVRSRLRLTPTGLWPTISNPSM